MAVSALHLGVEWGGVGLLPGQARRVWHTCRARHVRGRVRLAAGWVQAEECVCAITPPGAQLAHLIQK